MPIQPQPNPLFLIAGPCVIESERQCLDICEAVKPIADELGIPYYFKASYDKANRSSVESFRGPGMDEGLRILAKVRDTFDVPVLTDVHECCQVEPAAEVVDVIQIPAFLCRQTDLLVAAGKTGKTVNAKKGQFMAPHDMGNVVDKIRSTGNDQIWLTERGTSYGYNNLIADLRSIPIMKSFGCPVVFDATHSVQRPGGLGTASGGDRDFVECLTLAAIAAGCDGLFLEVHLDPDSAKSDAATQVTPEALRAILQKASEVRSAVHN